MFHHVAELVAKAGAAGSAERELWPHSSGRQWVGAAGSPGPHLGCRLGPPHPPSDLLSAVQYPWAGLSRGPGVQGLDPGGWGVRGSYWRATPSWACTCWVSGSSDIPPHSQLAPRMEELNVERGWLWEKRGETQTPETKTMWPQARGHLGPPGAGRGRQDPPGTSGGSEAPPTPGSRTSDSRAWGE